MKKAVSIIVMLTILAGLLMGCGQPDKGEKPTDDPQSKEVEPTVRPENEQDGEVDIKYSCDDTGALPGKLGVRRFDGGEGFDDWSLYVSARDINPGGMMLCFERRSPSDEMYIGELACGEQFTLEILKDGQWAEAPRVIGLEELSWIELAYVLPEYKTTEQDVSWESIYGELAPGSYRLVKEIINESSEKRDYYVRFDIVDTAENSAISCQAEGVSISVPIIGGWEYAIAEGDGESHGFGVDIRPEGEDGWVQLRYYKLFGVCGTGLKSEDITLGNGMSGHIGTYDGKSLWDFMSFPAGEGNFVVRHVGSTSWLAQRSDEVMDILDRSLMSWPKSSD